MSWARVDDRTHEDPRSEAAGVEAMGLWALALSYMAAHSTDGRITVERCRRLAGAQKGKRYAERLVAAGWWNEEGEGAYRLVEWERLLLPRAAVEERSVRAAEAGRKGGEARAARAREASQGAKVEASFGVRSGVSLPPDTGSCSGSLPANSAQEQETVLPTPAHDPDPTRPVTETARARDDVQAQVRETPRTEDRQEGGAAIGGARPVLTDLCVAPAVETVESKQTAGTTPALPGLEHVVDPDPAPPTPKPEDLVWAAYLEGRAMARVKGGAPVLDAKRKALINARLKDGFTVEDLCCAARGIWRSDWHLENGHTSLDLALRNAAQIERFREGGKPPKPVDPEWERRRRGPPPFVPPPLSPEKQQAILDQYFPGVYTKKAAANG